MNSDGSTPISGTASCVLTWVSVSSGVKLKRVRVNSASVVNCPAIRYS
jgi:hypothetical protein